MSQELLVLTGTAAFLGFFHTLLGPDHYLPFVAMSKARCWSRGKTAWITLLCGVGHVASSIILGTVGIAAGISLSWLELTESIRGDIAAWCLTAFGLVYFIWGLRRAIRNRQHTHIHSHDGETRHAHVHAHHRDHLHPHDAGGKSITPWVLFTIFLFGPCEPLIPMLMWPAAASSAWGVALVSLVFGLVTISTMLAMVLLTSFGMESVGLRRLGRYAHPIAGGAVFLCGVAIHMGL